MKAKAMNLWKYIDPDCKDRPHWPEVPGRPTYGMFNVPETPVQKKERLMKLNADLATARNNRNGAPLVPDDTVVGDDGPKPRFNDDRSATIRTEPYTLDNLPPIKCTEIFQLDKDDLAVYTDLCNVYREEKDDWERVTRSKMELADWVLDSVERPFAENKLLHDLDLEKWFALIGDHAKPYVEHQYTVTERAYPKHLHLYEKRGKERPLLWIKEWEDIMDRGSRLDCCFVKLPGLWFTEPIRALVQGDVTKYWAQIASLSWGGEVRRGSLTYQQIAAELRGHLYRTVTDSNLLTLNGTFPNETDISSDESDDQSDRSDRTPRRTSEMESTQISTLTRRHAFEEGTDRQAWAAAVAGKATRTKIRNAPKLVQGRASRHLRLTSRRSYAGTMAGGVTL